ncbi:E3 ubiquitin/ISG15 ligase TRIM25-like [Scleropages formosus]|uniref:E3 ubiquitin/ISG15 ligase TRIM25-like n=1 Tax=Scleropages formosus TaxID=113540 RepID=UPI0010FA9406|nr:E3 ubiquitin/ISG15 ligase TRIM25-like [Scleropages formosus]
MAQPMSAMQPKTPLEMDLTCSVCQDIFRNPHLLPCGHTFCMECVTGMLNHVIQMGGFRCPDCRTYFGPLIKIQKNFALASIAENFREAQEEKDESIAYCDCCAPGEQEVAVDTCLRCEVSMCNEHIKPHLVLPAFRGHPLTRAQGNAMERKCKKHKEYKRYSSASKEYVCNMCVVETIYTDNIAKMSSAMEKKITDCIMEHSGLLGEKLQGCQSSIWKLKDNMHQPIQKVEKSTSMTIIMVVLLLFGIMAAYCGHVASQEMKHLFSALQKTLLTKVHTSVSRLTGDDVLTLDPVSASLFLEVSADLLSVERRKEPLLLPPHPYRFDKVPQVLSAQCFATGNRHWEVEAEGYWDIAVTYSSIWRKDKGNSTFGFNNMSWSLTHHNKNLFVYHNGVKQELCKHLSNSKVAVTINHQDGIISFWDASILSDPLYTFHTKFTEPVCLGFGLYKAEPPTRISIQLSELQLKLPLIAPQLTLLPPPPSGILGSLTQSINQNSHEEK